MWRHDSLLEAKAGRQAEGSKITYSSRRDFFMVLVRLSRVKLSFCKTAIERLCFLSRQSDNRDLFKLVFPALDASCQHFCRIWLVYSLVWGPFANLFSFFPWLVYLIVSLSTLLLSADALFLFSGNFPRGKIPPSSRRSERFKRKVRKICRGGEMNWYDLCFILVHQIFNVVCCLT